MFGESYKIEDIPEGASIRDKHVRGHREDGELYFVAPGRRVIDIPGETWPAARPERCQGGRDVKTRWYEDKVLLCVGCGLDCT